MNGGKADNLRRLKALGFPVPEWFVIGPDEAADEAPDEESATVDVVSEE